MSTRYVGAAPRHSRKHEICVTLDYEDWETLTAFARAKGWTLSYFLRTLALRYVAREQKGDR